MGEGGVHANKKRSEGILMRRAEEAAVCDTTGLSISQWTAVNVY